MDNSFIPTKILPELLRLDYAKHVRPLLRDNAFGRVVSRQPGVNRHNEVLLAAVERWAGRTFSDADIADATARYQKRQAAQSRCVRAWRARLAPERAAAIRERNAEQARARRVRLRDASAHQGGTTA